MAEEGRPPGPDYGPQNTPQPAPQPQSTDPRQAAHWLVCADLLERAAMGQTKYGVPLMADNGRDHLIDLYQELLDALCYARMELERRRQIPLMAVEQMATMLSLEGYMVYAPHERMPEKIWRRIGEMEGYLATLGAEESEAVNEAEAIMVLQARGYGIMPPPRGEEAVAAPGDDDMPTEAQHPPLAQTPAQPSPYCDGDTILVRAVKAWQVREGREIGKEQGAYERLREEVRQALASQGICPPPHYMNAISSYAASRDDILRAGLGHLFGEEAW